MSTQAANDYDYEEKFQEELKKIPSNSLKHKLVAIRNLVVKRLALEKEFKSLNFKLEAKYEEMYAPVYKIRAQVIEGTQEVSVEEIKDQLANINLSDGNSTDSEKGVPQFWLKCLKNTAQFKHLINKKDEELLGNLKDIKCDFKENGSFTLSFYFAPNAFFDAPVLSREHILDSEKLTISKIVSSKIEWKSNEMNPTVEMKKKKTKNSKIKNF
jgi:nucleosome assembly protein 1-like 1